jgi:hypothetical protein
MTLPFIPTYNTYITTESNTCNIFSTLKQWKIHTVSVLHTYTCICVTHTLYTEK